MSGEETTVAEIAADEASHAELAADIAAWLGSKLGTAEVARVESAQRRALRGLEVSVDRLASQPAREALGLPTPEVAARLLAGARSLIWTRAREGLAA